MISAILLFPAIAWSLNGINTLLKDGLYSYTSLPPFPLKIHISTLLLVTTFYLTTFLIIKPYKPLKNFLISFSLLFLSNTVYELVYAVFICNTPMLTLPLERSAPLPFSGIVLTLPLILGGILLLLFLNRRFHFLTNDKNKILLFLLYLSSFITVTFMLHYTGFFKQMTLYLSGQTTNDPHNPLWVLSKVLCVWAFFPLLNLHPKVG